MKSTLIERMPRLIQAGMGIHISSARLANATSRLGALGVVSGAALRHIVLEDIRANDEEAISLAKLFPIACYVEEALAYMPGAKKHRHAIPVDTPDPRHNALPRRLSAIAAFVEVMRAKRGHRGKVGINIMWKCPLTALPSIYGAMLAGVDALLCGAGVPMELPDIVAKIRAGQNMEYLPLTGTGTNVRLDIDEDANEVHHIWDSLKPPKLLPILSNFAFSKRILETWQKKYHTSPFAFVLENHAAGGHNAPPRNKSTFSDAELQRTRNCGGYSHTRICRGKGERIGGRNSSRALCGIKTCGYGLSKTTLLHKSKSSNFLGAVPLSKRGKQGDFERNKADKLSIKSLPRRKSP